MKEPTPPWSWTPVFDFLWSMKVVLDGLERGERTRIGLTENAELIDFVPASLPKLVPEPVPASLPELVAEGERVRIGGEHPGLAVNPAVTELRLAYPNCRS